jgi:hypothetical protein
MKRKGFHLASEQEIVRDHINFDVAFRRDPDGLCRAVGAALNEMLRDDPMMQGWEWGLDWHNLPGAISVSVSGTNKGQIDAFFAATSVADYNEVDAAAERLAHRVRRYISCLK